MLTVPFVGVEIALRVAMLASPLVVEVIEPSAARQVPDAVLGHRLNPRYREYDDWGYRNDAVPDRARVVALGDSFTHGVLVPREDAWPQKFQALTGVETYNMGIPGYSPAHSYVVWDEALSLQPELVLFGMYAGNDLYDCFNIVYVIGKLPELRTDDSAVLEAIAQAEAQRKVVDEFRGYVQHADYSLKGLLEKHSRFYGLARATRNYMGGPERRYREPSWDQVMTSTRPAFETLFESGDASTTFTIKHRLRAVDLDDPRIQEGHRVAFRSFKMMRGDAASKGIRFAVILFPTKEFTYADLVEKKGLGQFSAEYQKLVANEAEMWRRTREFLDEEDIPYLDTLPILRRMVREGPRPFRKDSDSHMTIAGNEQVAEALRGFVAQEALLSAVPENP